MKGVGSVKAHTFYTLNKVHLYGLVYFMLFMSLKVVNLFMNVPK